MSDQKTIAYPVLLAGGSGTRLWPVSRELYPKQLVSFIGKDSLVQSTIKRVAPVLGTDRVRIVCGKEHFHEMARHMEEIGVPAEGKIVCEPCGRNTAPAVLLALLNIMKKEKEAVLCVFPADHVIRDIGNFHEKLSVAVNLADQGHIVTFGIRPHYPETGYGYIEAGRPVSEGALWIKRFVEKPDRKTAEQYIEAGNFFWNSGMFAFKASVLSDEFKAFEPELFKKMEEMVFKNDSDAHAAYEQLPNISIDCAIMEKTDKGVVLPSDFGWSDIGSWKSLYDFLPKDENHNVLDGDVIAKDTENCFIMGYERLIATNYLRDMVVVETPDSVFVSDLDHSRDVKSIVEQLRQTGRKEYHTHTTVYHPWGNVTVLEHREDVKVNRLILYPRSTFKAAGDLSAVEHLVVTKGTANVSGGMRRMFLKEGESIVISDREAFEIENAGKEPACIIHVQLDRTI